MTPTPTSPATLRERLSSAVTHLVYATLDTERARAEAVNGRAVDTEYADDLAAFAKDKRASLDALHDEVVRDAERLDWIQETFGGTGHTLLMGGVCYWAVEKQRGGPRSAITRLGEGDDLREAIDAARSSALPETTDDA